MAGEKAGPRPPAGLRAAAGAYNRPVVFPPTRLDAGPMDKKTMMQVLLPAAAAAGVVLLVGVLIALGTKEGGADIPATKAAGATTLAFAADAPEWLPLDDAKYPGLKYWDMTVGTGEPCPPGANVTIHYTGWTLDGKKFDSSKDRGPPADFALAGLIKGWQAGVPGMKPGGVRRLSIPYQFAYGEAGSPPNIPAKATLLFEMELVSFK